MMDLSDLHQRYDGPIPDLARDAALAGREPMSRQVRAAEMRRLMHSTGDAIVAWRAHLRRHPGCRAAHIAIRRLRADHARYREWEWMYRHG